MLWAFSSAYFGSMGGLQLNQDKLFWKLPSPLTYSHNLCILTCKATTQQTANILGYTAKLNRSKMFKLSEKTRNAIMLILVLPNRKWNHFGVGYLSCHTSDYLQVSKNEKLLPFSTCHNFIILFTSKSDINTAVLFCKGGN